MLDRKQKSNKYNKGQISQQKDLKNVLREQDKKYKCQWKNF